MIDKRVVKLLKLLSDSNYKTSEELSIELNVSSKTVRILLKNLNDILEGNGANILAKRRFGYILLINDSKKYNKFKLSIKETEEKELVPNTPEERIKYLLKYLLEHEEFIKIDDLCEELYVSRKTISSNLKRVEEILKRYSIQLIRKPNYGIKVVGKEFDFRLCIANFTMNKKFIVEHKDKFNDQVGIISIVVSRKIKKNNIKMSSVAFQNLIVHIYIAIERIKEECYVAIEKNYLEEIIKSEEYLVAKEIVTELKNTLKIDFPQSEIGYIAIHLAGKRIYYDDVREERNIIISDRVTALVREMLNIVYNSFKIDFRNDLDLIISLSQHIMPFEVRLKYNMQMKNPMLKEIKESFLLAFEMATQSCIVIKNHYEKEISQDEIGYIALSFELALERKNNDVIKKNILIVCASGKGSAKLLVYKYQEEFGKYINEIKTSDIYGLEKIDFNNIDYVFTTVPINIKVQATIIEVQYFLEDKEIKKIKRTLSTENIITKSYFDKRLFFTDLEFKTKQEILKFMCYEIAKVHSIPKNFYNSVIAREKLVKTEFGNLIAMPHPNKALSEESFVCVAILKEPIIWNERKVQFIFLLSIENKINKNLQQFYKITSKLLFNKYYINEVIKRKDFNYFINLLDIVEKEIEI